MLDHHPHPHGEDDLASAHVCLDGHESDPAPSSERDEAVDEARAGTGLSRRSIIAGLTAAAGAAGATALTPATAAAAVPTRRPRGGNQAELVLLGTRAGPPPVPSQAGISSALVVNGATYVIDCGRASVTQFVHAGLKLRSIRGVFITHLHADHIADYYNYFMLGAHIPNAYGDNIAQTVPIVGPGPAGGLPPSFGGGMAPTIAPENPTPGLKATTDLLHRAYAYSSNVFLRDMKIADIRTRMDVREIRIPDVGANFRNTAPPMAPFEVFRDENVRVTATLVPHVLFPAFAYRFDTEYGSVTFSGDTAKSDNLIRLAQDTGILVHEAIGIEGSTAPAAVIDHMLQSHVLVSEVGPIAQAAGAHKLVLSHTADIAHEPIDAAAWQRAAQRGYTRGPAIFGRDLRTFRVKH